MAGITNVGGADVIETLAACGCSIMTTETVIDKTRMIHCRDL